MKKIYITLFVSSILFAGGFYFFSNYNQENREIAGENEESEEEEEGEEGDKATVMKEVAAYWKNAMQDPTTGKVPIEEMLKVYEQIEQFKQQPSTKSGDMDQAFWRSRGPRAVGGRTRALLIDKSDPTGNTVFAAGVSGGLWKTTQINAADPQWKIVNDYFDNLNIVTIAQDPNDPDLMFFGTGELHVGTAGLGIWRSKDGGDTWQKITNYNYTNKMVVHPNGDVYAGTSSFMYRSQDDGDTWQVVQGPGTRINDIEISTDGSIYLAGGLNNSARIYKSPGGSTVGNNGTWQNIGLNTGFPTGLSRVELATTPADPNIIYAFVARSSAARSIHKSVNGGQTWTQTSLAPQGIDYTSIPGDPSSPSPQGWYDLMIDVAPDNANIVIIGAVGIRRSTDGGGSWSRLNNIHVDHHEVLFDDDRPGRVYFGNDGGVYRSVDNGFTIQNRNLGYIVTQFYATAIHPDKYSNYFLAGAQDNSSRKFTEFGISSTTVARGGDGFACHIDQNDPRYQVVSSQNGNWGFSFDGGESWGGGLNLNSGFYSKSDYDDETQMLYSHDSFPGYIHRWEVPLAQGNEVNITNSSDYFNTIQVSPNVSNRLYLGTNNGRVMIVDNMNTGNSKSATFRNIPGSGNVSSIAIEEGNENHIVVTVSNFNTTNVFESFNEGGSWAAVDGNLPNMPVWYALFHPTDPDKLFIGTEAGVWVTEDLDGGNTQWTPVMNGVPFTRVTQLYTRPSDHLILASTYGRGLFTTDYLSPAAINLKAVTVAYIDGSIDLVNESINAHKWLWDFGTGATSTDETPTLSFSAAGTYNVDVTMNDTLSEVLPIKVLPNLQVPYNPSDGGDFESNDGHFGTYSVSGSAFTKGKSSFALKNGTKSGDNAYVLAKDDNFYENNTEARLYTPAYDLSEPGIYEFSFWAKYGIQWGWDGLQVEYSTDKGSNWSVLGKAASNWYNYENEQNITSFPAGSAYITGTSTEFTQFKVGLNELIGQSNVAFRFVFKSNAGGTSAGIAIDDIKIRRYTDVLETRIIQFEGDFKGQDEVTLTWTTLPEYNCKGFKVQYSENGRFDTEGVDYTEFSILIDAQGSSIDPVSYVFEPKNMTRDLYYFRIKVFDFNDDFFHTDKIILRRGGFAGDNLDITLIYPNPFTDYLDIAFNQHINETINFNMYDAAGRLVVSNALNPKDSYYRMATEQLQSGVYILQIIAGDVTITKKLLKL